MAATLCCTAQLKRYSFTAAKMGSPFTIIMYHTDSAAAAVAADACFRLVDSLVFIFSDYIDSSELNRLCAAAGQPVKVSAPLFDILQQSKQAFIKSKGTFDVTMGPVTRLWRKARKEKIFPPAAVVKEKLALTGFRKVYLDSAAQTVTLLQKGMLLDLGGIAQGYIAQKVADYLQTQDVTIALVNVSGDITTAGAPPGTRGWTVGVTMPESDTALLPRHLLVKDKTVTTSGDVYQFIEHNGKKYSHIVHPKTGYGITSQRTVTVIANDGATGDWLTKACSLLPVATAKQLANSLNAALLVTTIEKGKPAFYSTKSFDAYWKRQ